MKVSLALTVLNEGEHVRRLFDSVLKQTRPPDEVVVCDGGSRDNTVAVIQSYASQLPLNVISLPGANISQGRNAAIKAATGEVIAVTDAGVWLEPGWLEALLKPWAEANSDTALVAGFFHSDPSNTFEVALGATTLPDMAEIDPAKFLPSSRSAAFRKSAWATVGGYPEWLDFSEDVVFDLNIRKQLGAFAFAPGAVAHFRPRATLRSFARQYYNYAKGDGRANLWPRIHLIRYFTYLVAAPLGLYAALIVSPWLWLLGALAGLAYIRRPLQRLMRSGKFSLVAALWVPVIRVTGDIAKMVGYPVGVWQRITSRKSG
jgi:glycosyltransferase involved in cell wall biosynthesis